MHADGRNRFIALIEATISVGGVLNVLARFFYVLPRAFHCLAAVEEYKSDQQRDGRDQFYFQVI